MARKWVTAKTAAEYFSLSVKTLYSLAARDRLGEKAVLRLGRGIRINLEAVELANLGKEKR